ncbi:Phospholipase B-like, partial [Caligus rogercresseyi]
TYNNQWMVVDYKRFKPGRKVIRPGLLWILEQIPGHIHYADVTGVLKKKGYWPSYNSPYFKDIFNLSGGPEAVAKHGDWFSYERTPLQDMSSMMKIMRYNDFVMIPCLAATARRPILPRMPFLPDVISIPRMGPIPLELWVIGVTVDGYE